MNCQRLCQFLKHKDRFGYPITLKYQKESVYKSTIGGIFTLISFSLLILYFLYLSIGTFQREGYTVSNSLHQNDLSVDNSLIELTLDNFDISLQLFYEGENATIKDNIDLYFSSYIQTVHYELILDKAIIEELGTDIIYDQTYVKTEFCQAGRLNGKATDTGPGQFYKTLECPTKEFKFKLMGSWSRNQVQLMQIVVDYCQQDILDSKYPGMNKTCINKDEANKIINSMFITAPLLKQYFDDKDFSENPIKTSLSNDIYAVLHPSMSIKYEFKISQNKVKLRDSWISSFLDNRELKYIDNKFSFIYFNQHEQEFAPLLTFQFILDENELTKERTVNTILDAISKTGGMMGIVFPVVSILIGWIQETLFHISIMKEIFFIQIAEDKDSSLRKQNKSKKVQSTTSAPSQQTKPENQSISEIENIDLGDNNQQDIDINKVTQYIRSLKVFAYTFKDYLFFKFRRLFACRKLQRKFKDSIYVEGMAKLEAQFDIVKVMRTMRKVDLLAQITLTKYQQELIPYMKNNVLGCEKIPLKAIIKTQIKRKLYQSIQQLVSQSASSKIDKRILKDLEAISKDDKEPSNIRELEQFQNAFASQQPFQKKSRFSRANKTELNLNPSFF